MSFLDICPFCYYLNILFNILRKAFQLGIDDVKKMVKPTIFFFFAHK